MANKATSTTSSSLKKLEEQLTCAVCLDFYTDPKTLPCHHSFCLKCLERLSQDSQGGAITCPTCHVELPKPAGAADFPAAFQLNQLAEIYNQMKKEFTPQQVTCDNCKKVDAIGYCKECSKYFCRECDDVHKKWGPTADHQLSILHEVKVSASQLPPTKQETVPICSSHQEPLEFFCEACDEVICLPCTKETHKGHEYKKISASYDRHCQLLQSCLVPVKEKVSGIKSALTALAVTENEIREQRETMREEIRVMVEKMMIGLQNKLGKEMEAIIEGKLQVLSKQRNSAETSLSRVKDCEEYVEQILKTDSPQQVLMYKKEMMERMSQVTQQINTEEFNPIEKADMRLMKDSRAVKSLDDIGVVISTSALQQCKVKEISNIQHHPNKKMVSFHLSMKLPNSNLLIVPPPSLICSLIPVGKGQPIPTTVTSTTQRGVYRIQFNPSTSGLHQVNVLVHDVQLESISLMIPFNPYLDTITPVRTVYELNSPWGVGVTDDGRVMVAECIGNNNGRVVILDREGKKVKCFGGEGGSGNVKFHYPYRAAITADNHILVSDAHRIQKITMDGQLVVSVGANGSEPRQFHCPTGMTISPVTGRIFIADSGNHRVQVLNPDFTFARKFGMEGSAEGQFKNPYDISIDSQGLLYVADRNNHRIQKFTPEGVFLAQFGTQGSGPGQLNNPYGITVDANNLVYVTEHINHRVSIFTSEGQFVRCYGEQGVNEDQFKNPRGITINKEGIIYICDHGNNRLVVY